MMNLNRNIYKCLLPLLFLIFCLACGSNIETNLSSKEIIDSASQKVSSWNSFRFSLDHDKGVTSLSSGLYKLKSVRGEVVLPRRVKLETNAITFGQLVKLDVVLIDEKSYWTNPINQKWSEIPGGESPFGTFDVSEVILDILENIENPTKYGDVSGEIQKITGKVEAKVFEPLVGTAEEGKIADVIISINLRSMNVVSATITGKVNPLDENEVIRIIEIWDVDSEINVDPPL